MEMHIEFIVDRFELLSHTRQMQEGGRSVERNVDRFPVLGHILDDAD